MTDKTPDALLPDDEIPNEIWLLENRDTDEDYEYRVIWSPHSDCERIHKGYKIIGHYKAAPHAEAVRVLHAALKRFTDEIPTGWDDDQHPFSDEVDQAYKAQAHPAVVAVMSSAEDA
jgi:hypothetical protein